jgi:hypothetical protein
MGRRGTAKVAKVAKVAKREEDGVEACSSMPDASA